MMFKYDISVEKVDTSRGWFYYSYDVCNKKLTEVNNSYSCYNRGPKIPKLTKYD